MQPISPYSLFTSSKQHHSGFKSKSEFVLGVIVRLSRLFAEVWYPGFATVITATLTRVTKIFFPPQRPRLIPLPSMQLVMSAMSSQQPPLSEFTFQLFELRIDNTGSPTRDHGVI